MNSYYKYYFESKEIPGTAARIRAKNLLIYRMLAPYLAPGAPVLELGVGKGWFAEVCREKGHPYAGVESNDEACRALREGGIEVTCARVPPVPVEPPADGFGLVYSAHMLEHLGGSQAVHELFGECRRLLAPGGVAAMLFPDAMALGKHFWNCDYTHVWPTTERRVSQAMSDAGLEVVATHRLSGHYTGARRLLARVGAQPLALRAAQAITRDSGKRELYYRGWLYLQQDLLLMAVVADGGAGPHVPTKMTKSEREAMELEAREERRS